MIDLGVEYDIIDKRGAYYRFNDDLIGQGREASKDALRQNVVLATTIDGLVRARAGLPERHLPLTLDGEGEDVAQTVAAK